MSYKSKYDVSGKVVIITGGASGFGANLAPKLASRKPRVLILVDVQKELGEKVAKEVGAEHNVKTVFKRVDLSNMEEVKGMVNSTVEEYGQLDVLVNNAGIGDASWPKAIDALDTSAPSSSWVRMTMINYCAPIYATELAVVHSKKKGNKLVVVNVASVAGLIPQKEPIYASGKAGLIHFSRCLGYLAPQVRVNNVLPNAAPTPLFLSGTDKEFLEMMKSNMVTINDVSEAMVTAIENEAMAGETIRVVPRGTDVWDFRRSKAVPIGQFSGKL